MSIGLPGYRLGIIGGGQLGRMMAVEARRLGIMTICLDPADHPPAQGIADRTIKGNLYNALALQDLAHETDSLTFEIEHTNVKALSDLVTTGAVCHPAPETLGIIQDKLTQKRFLVAHGLPVPGFKEVPEDSKAWKELRATTDYPFVLKTRSGGYDGRGVTIIRSPGDARSVLPGPCLMESMIEIRTELAVLIARSTEGDMRTYPVIEMVFDPREQICSSVCAPARIPDEVAKKAIEIAESAVTALDGVGVFAVELFLDTSGNILINEIAPRPHNSGHWTIEGAVTNQFEQHIRAVTGLPLGDASLVRPSVMVNLLGASNAVGRPVLAGAEEALAIPGVKLHWYQKESVKPYRKMGHITVSHDSLDRALEIADELTRTVVVKGS